MKDNPTPTLPLSGEGAKARETPKFLIEEGAIVKKKTEDLLGQRTDVGKDEQIEDNHNLAPRQEQHSKPAPPPGKGEAGRGLKQPRLHNLKPQLKNRRQLRKNSTEPEKRFWSWVRSKQLGCKFRRQQGIGQYIVDFYCAEHALIIELDGDSHYTDKAIVYDSQRTQFLTTKGFKVLRFTNLEVMQNKEGVLSVIMSYLERGISNGRY
ncbi:MAG: endonuclease domain-containing protein [Methylococcales bacterium]|nr:endonuclease domain-containing protein [Methylococcales bacterium]